MPITGEELEAMKLRANRYGKRHSLSDSFDVGQFDQLADRIAVRDFPACIAEIERLRADFESLRNETARIVLLAEDQPCTDGHTFCVKFTKELLAELRALLAQP